MKSLYYVAFFIGVFLEAPCARSQTAAWSPAVSLARGSSPRLAVDPNDGSMHVNYIGYSSYWTSSGMQYAHLAVTDGQIQVLTREGVAGGEGDQGYWLGGTAIAVDGGGNPHMLVRAHGEFGVFSLYHSRRTVAGWVRETPALKSNVLRGFSIDMAFDGSDVLHIAWCEKTDEWHDGSYAQISGGSLTNITAGFNGTRWDNGAGIAVTPDGGVHLVYGQPYSGNFPIAYYHSGDGGATFQLVDWITSASDQFVRAGHPDIALDAAGNAYICYGSGKDESNGVNSKIQFVRFSNGSKTAHVTVAQGGSGPGDLDPDSYRWFVSDIAVSPDGRNVAVIYLAMDKAGEEYTLPGTSVVRSVGGPLYARVSGDYGATWSDAAELTPLCYLYDGRSQPCIEASDDMFYAVYESRDSVYVRFYGSTGNTEPGETPPAAGIAGSLSGLEGDGILLDGSGSVPSSGGTALVEYAWDVDGNGTFDIVTASAQYTYAWPDDYSGPVVLRVTDDTSLSGYDTVDAVIANRPPSVSGGADTTLIEGGRLVRAAAASDVPADVVTCTWSCGSWVMQGSVFGYQFPDNGVYACVVRAVDEDGGAATDTVFVTVLNAKPTARISGPSTGLVNVPVGFDASASFDPGVQDSLTFQWDFNGDQQYDTTGMRLDWTFTAAGVYHIHLRVADKDGASDSASAVCVISEATAVDEPVLPASFGLQQNYPNPFNPRTTISYELPRAVHVRLSVYNPLGRRVRVLYDAFQSAGFHSLLFDGRDDSGRALPCGVYICHMTAGSFTGIRKMLLVE
ncbi:PKD domain-containing protein [bacterium]|nr:PKD domain-containing protein [bacterium]